METAPPLVKLSCVEHGKELLDKKDPPSVRWNDKDACTRYGALQEETFRLLPQGCHDDDLSSKKAAGPEGTAGMAIYYNENHQASKNSTPTVILILIVITTTFLCVQWVDLHHTVTELAKNAQIQEQIQGRSLEKDCNSTKIKMADSSDTPTRTWKSIGYLNDLVLKDTENEYPFTHFEWGATYNTRNILPVAIVGCHTVIMSVTRPYAQNDDGADLAWGTTVETSEEPSRKGKFKQSYFRLRDGQFMVLFCNNTGSPSMFVRSLPAPWIYRRTVYLRSELDELMESFPFTKYEWATDFDGHSILPLTITDWNLGIRIHVTNPYVFGDSLDKAQMGTPVWTHGTDDKESKEDHFVQRYMKVQSFGHTKLPGVWDRGFPLYTRALDPSQST